MSFFSILTGLCLLSKYFNHLVTNAFETSLVPQNTHFTVNILSNISTLCKRTVFILLSILKVWESFATEKGFSKKQYGENQIKIGRKIPEI